MGQFTPPRVPERDEDLIENDLLISLVQERVPLWDTRVPQHSDNVTIRRLWNEVAKAIRDGWDNAPTRVRNAFVARVKTRWRSMKDRFNKDLRQESRVPIGSGARIRKYKYHRVLAFLRPILNQRTTWSSTVGPGSGAVLHQTATDPSQPSSSAAASGPATQTGDQEAGPSGLPLSQSSATAPFFWGSSRQRQRALDRSMKNTKKGKIQENTPKTGRDAYLSKWASIQMHKQVAADPNKITNAQGQVVRADHALQPAHGTLKLAAGRITLAAGRITLAAAESPLQLAESPLQLAGSPLQLARSPQQLPDHPSSWPDHPSSRPDHPCSWPDHPSSWPDHPSSWPDHPSSCRITLAAGRITLAAGRITLAAARSPLQLAESPLQLDRSP
ncbi:uncharacterized protein LOC143817725 [Ranitomeya variabilis]|uniref:uncharacterized protein LOC143817725 n=1 Tax=Ranitomeya variabilis TaxID=490064 RepID=UPI004056AC75